MMSEQPRGCLLRNVELVKDRAQFGTGHLSPSNREPRLHPPHLHGLPFPFSGRGPDAARIERQCDAMKCCHAARLYLGDDGGQCCRPRVGARCADFSEAMRAFVVRAKRGWAARVTRAAQPKFL